LKDCVVIYSDDAEYTEDDDKSNFQIASNRAPLASENKNRINVIKKALRYSI
jgi:hypothetical protein